MSFGGPKAPDLPAPTPPPKLDDSRELEDAAKQQKRRRDLRVGRDSLRIDPATSVGAFFDQPDGLS